MGETCGKGPTSSSCPLLDPSQTIEASLPHSYLGRVCSCTHLSWSEASLMTPHSWEGDRCQHCTGAAHATGVSKSACTYTHSLACTLAHNSYTQVPGISPTLVFVAESRVGIIWLDSPPSHFWSAQPNSPPSNFLSIFIGINQQEKISRPKFKAL